MVVIPVYYWPSGDWLTEEEFEDGYGTGYSDDYEVFEVPINLSDEQIDKHVQQLTQQEYTDG